MKVIIAGNRSLGRRYAEVERAMEDAALAGIKPTEVICGMARGADLLGKEWADRRNIPVREFEPDWTTHGRAAGPIRNSEMAAVADALVAVWDGESKGTRDMIKKAQKKGLKVYVHYFTPDPKPTVFDFGESSLDFGD